MKIPVQSGELERPHFKALIKEKELWLLILVGIVYFHRPLFLGETFFFREIYLSLFPQKQLLMDCIKTGTLPLWDPYLNGGQPYLANIGSTVLYPANLLYVFLPFLTAFNVSFVSHFILSSITAYLLARTLKFQPISSCLVGIVYGFCGYTLSLSNLTASFWATPSLPLLVLFWHVFWLEGRKKWFAWSICIGVIRVLSGAPEANTIGLLFLLLWMLVYPYPSRSFLRKIVLWGILGIFILGIASIQLFPTVEMASLSPRASQRTYTSFAQWSLPLKRLPEMIIPEFFGKVNTLREFDYWGLNLVDRSFPNILSIYWGGTVLFLALFGGLYKKESKCLPLRLRRVLLGIFIVCLPLSLGRFLPGFEIIYRVIPFVGFFRYPVKFLLPTLLPIALLVGYAAEVQFGERYSVHSEEREWIPTRSMFLMLWSAAVFFSIVTLSFFFSDTYVQYAQQVFFKSPVDREIFQKGMMGSFTHAAAIWLSITLLYHYRAFTKRRWQYWILLCVITADLLIAGKHVNPTTPREFFTEVPPLASFVKKEVGTGRFFRPENSSPVSRLNVPSNDVVWKYRWDLETLKYYSSTIYRIPMIFYRGLSLSNIHVGRLSKIIDSVPWERRIPLLSAGNVTMILTEDTLVHPHIQSIGEVPNRSNLRFNLYRNTDAMDTVKFVTNWGIANSDETALHLMLGQNFDPHEYAVVHPSKKELAAQKFEVRLDEEERKQCREFSKITNIESNIHSMSLTVSNQCDGFLVFSEPFYPGWHVTVDGKSNTMLRANYAFSAVFLEAGYHQVVRRYRPLSLLLGLIVSSVFCVALVAFLSKSDFSWII